MAAPSNWSYHIGKAAHNDWYNRNMRDAFPGGAALCGDAGLALAGLL
jgi:hypothetical protein